MQEARVRTNNLSSVRMRSVGRIKEDSWASSSLRISRSLCVRIATQSTVQSVASY